MSRAVTLANFASGEALTLDETNDRVGIASTTPDATLDIKNTVLIDGDAGVVTATSFSGDISGNISGVAATFTGAVSVGGTLTYEDVTNIDSVGVLTARTGIKVLAGGINAVGVVTATSYIGDGSALTGIAATDNIAAASLTVSGITTHYGDIQLQNGVGVGNSVTWDASAKSLIFKDNSSAKFGDGSDLSIYHDSTNTQIHNTTGTLRIRGDSIKLNNAGATKNAIVCESDAVDLYHDGNKTFATVAGGINLYHMVGSASTVRMLRSGSVGTGIGVTTTAGRNAAGAAGTVTGQIVYNETSGKVEYYNNGWYAISVTVGELIETQTFSYTGANQTFNKPGALPPAGSIDIFAFGAGGGTGGYGGTNAYGGGGGFVAASFPASSMPGSTFTIVVGEGGHPANSADAASSYGGGGTQPQAPSTPHSSASGGGYAGVFDGPVTQGNAFVIAGGGGGAGYSHTYGGQGGGSTGGDAGSPQGPAQPLTGKGGTPTAGGAVGSPNPDGGLAGSALQGGNVPGANLNAGGGGGGYYGGGAGSVGPYDGGGGGGSAYVHPTAQSAPTPRIPGGSTINVGGQGSPGPRSGPSGVPNMRYSAGGPNGQSTSPHHSSGIGEAGTTADSSGGNGLVVIKTYY